MLVNPGQTSEHFILFVVTLISVTVTFLVTSQLLRKLSAMLVDLTLISDISSSPEECSCHGKWRLRPSFRLPMPVSCCPFKIRTEILSFRSQSAALRADMRVMHFWWLVLPSSYGLLHSWHHVGLERGEERIKKNPKHLIFFLLTQLYGEGALRAAPAP